MKPLHITMTRKEQLWGLLYLFLSVLLLPLLIPYCVDLLFPGSSAAATNFIYFLVNFLSSVGIFHRFLIKTVEHLRASWKKVVLFAAIGLGAYFAMSTLLASVYLRFFPEFSNVNDENILLLAKENFALMAIGSVILVPVAEECLYRGVVFGAIFQKSPMIGYMLSTLVFSLIHVLRYIGAVDMQILLLCIVQYLPAGLCLSWAYQKADNLFAPILIHAVINALGIFL